MKREKVSLLFTGTDKGDVTITFDNVEKINAYIETLCSMRNDLYARIEKAKTEKKLRRAKNRRNILQKDISDLDAQYAEFNELFDKLSRREQEEIASFKQAIDNLYKFGKVIAEIKKPSVE